MKKFFNDLHLERNEMSKELEALEWLLANEMIYRGRTRLPISPALREIKQHLESIDNSNPSEALIEVDKILGYFGKAQIETMTLSKCNVLTIKQALQKQQELPDPFKTGVDIGVIKPKKYLKWEDLEKDRTYKVLLNGIQYELVKRYDDYEYRCDYITLQKKPGVSIFIYEYEKEIFNDLHLERVE